MPMWQPTSSIGPDIRRARNRAQARQIVSMRTCRREEVTKPHNSGSAIASYMKRSPDIFLCAVAFESKAFNPKATAALKGTERRYSSRPWFVCTKSILHLSRRSRSTSSTSSAETAIPVLSLESLARAASRSRARSVKFSLKALGELGTLAYPPRLRTSELSKTLSNYQKGTVARIGPRCAQRYAKRIGCPRRLLHAFDTNPYGNECA